MYGTLPFANASGYRFRGHGFSGVAAAGTTTQITLCVTDERYFNGLNIILAGHVAGDHGHLRVVDIDNVLGLGSNVILDEFATSWFFSPDSACQGDSTLPYPARIAAGLYLVIEYHSTGQQDVSVYANAYLHMKTEL